MTTPSLNLISSAESKLHNIKQVMAYHYDEKSLVIRANDP